ncbi:hypothetical protein QQS21_000402 [Conoideocrella luteorostrata]|uniref:Cytochrome P450 n=1 Tax=Conoideocrella luteorostrata TaxID=1105319 RepID=A0AAJ0FYG2_9HYPO|nr:hypothetical protein QQS21_000402 [Conoideocrella luteorostrata]
MSPFALLVAAVTSAALLYTILSAIYNICFHKLSSFPGPILARSGLVSLGAEIPLPAEKLLSTDQTWRICHSQRGRLHRAIQDAHRRYGPVVRFSPNELSFATVESWKAIYGHRTGGNPTPIKSEFYDIYGAGFKSLCIGSERDPHKHGKMRKMLSAAFATKSLVEQEGIIATAVDEFVHRVGEEGVSERGINMTKWYEMATFDMLGEMAFGQSFQSVKTGKPHFWSEIIVSHLYFITLIDNLRRLPFVASLAKLLFPSTLAVQNKNSRYARQKVSERLAKKSTRKDFLSVVVQNYEQGSIDREEMTAHVSTLTIAGAETTATFLAAVTYYLLKNPDCYQKLQAEISGRFASYEQVNATDARQLPYLQAIINEGLRIYAPGSGGFPRLSPGMYVGDIYVPAGAEMITHAWTLTHSEEYFSEPYAFKPERWLDPRSKDVKEASQPFSMGPRGCLGQNFAYMEVNLILAKLLWTYDLELLDRTFEWEQQSQLHVMWWKPDLMVRFWPRHARGR